MTYGDYTLQHYNVTDEHELQIDVDKVVGLWYNVIIIVEVKLGMDNNYKEEGIMNNLNQSGERIMEMNNDGLRKMAEEMISRLTAIIGHINAIKETNDVELINIYLDCIDEINSTGPVEFQKSVPVRVDVRNGQGDFSKIQEKCIRLGIV